MIKNDLRKFLAIILCVSMVFVYAACGTKDDAAETDEQQTETEEQTEDQQTEEQTEEQTGEQAEVESQADYIVDQQERAEASEDPLAGSYVETRAGRGVIILNDTKDGYEVDVFWSGSAYEDAQWHMTGSFDDNGVLEYSDCTKITVTYDEEGNETVEPFYDNGVGRLILNGETLEWDDEEENVADGAFFDKQDLGLN